MNPLSQYMRGCFSAAKDRHFSGRLQQRWKPLRSFTSTCRRAENDPQLEKRKTINAFVPKPIRQSDRQVNSGYDHFDVLRRNPTEATGVPSILSENSSASKEPYHLNVYATKHNCHITWTRPNREPILSKSVGNLNFKKGQRGEFDAAYQLSTFVMSKMQEKGLSTIDKGNIEIELILRGFGPGREAFTKALLSSEGRYVQDKITRVVDATRLKFGGTRSRNVRRL